MDLPSVLFDDHLVSTWFHIYKGRVLKYEYAHPVCTRGKFKDEEKTGVVLGQPFSSSGHQGEQRTTYVDFPII